MPLRASLARSLQYAMANMADIKTPLCALQPTPAIPHTASRSGAGTRGGERGLERAPARHGARVPPTPGPPAAGLACLACLAGSARPPRAALRAPRTGEGAPGSRRPAGPGKAAATSGWDARACVPVAGTCHRGAGRAGRAQRSAGGPGTWK